MLNVSRRAKGQKVISIPMIIHESTASNKSGSNRSTPKTHHSLNSAKKNQGVTLKQRIFIQGHSSNHPKNDISKLNETATTFLKDDIDAKDLNFIVRVDSHGMLNNDLHIMKGSAASNGNLDIVSN